MKHFYERNDYLLNHEVNKTFDEVLVMSKGEFKQWCVDLRHIVVYCWDILGIPPRVGYNEADIIDQFNQIQQFPVHKFLVKDELTGEQNVLRNTHILGNAVNQWFPSMMAVRINYTEKDDGKSIYDFFAKDNLLDRFVTYASRHFKRDSFYHYSQPVKMMDKEQYGSLPVAKDGTGWILEFEASYRQYGEYDYWLSPVDSDKEYSGYNEDIKSRKFLTVNDADILTLGANIPLTSQTNIDYKDTNNYYIRAFKKGQKLFPAGFKAFKVSFNQYAVNFPPLIAKWIYDTYTKPNQKNVIWDPSAGWAGRLLGAMSVKDDREVVYLANDPNKDHNIRNGKTKYHDIYEFYCDNVRKGGGLWPIPHNTFGFWQCGSEDMWKQPGFQEYKGKVDLVFTSPPYFNREAYSEDEEQSYKKFTSYESWREGFLKPTLMTAYQWLKPGGHIVWNIADLKIGKEYLPLEKDSCDMMESLGMKHIITYKMALGSMPGANRLNEDGTATAKNFAKVDGKIMKVEPIFVYQK